MDISTYLKVEDLVGSSKFFCDMVQLFTIQHKDNENQEMTLEYRHSPEFKLKLCQSTEQMGGALFVLSIEIESCRSLFSLLTDNQTDEFEWRVSQEFFGTYLSSPVGDQFAVRNRLNVGILFYSKLNQVR